MATDRDRPRIAVLGSVNMDLVTTVDRLPAPGETLMGTGFSTIPGGKGANQAIAASRAGGAVAFIGAVGSDAFGVALAATLGDARIDTASLRRVDGPSGIAAISVDAGAENTIVVVPGANSALTALDEPDLATIRGAAILLAQLEIPVEAVTAGALAAAAAGVPVLLNPSPVRDLPAELIAAVTVIVVNEGEAAAIGRDALATIPHVVTTLGGAGAAYRGPDGETITVPAPRVVAVDSTGAGDAFTGALAVAWAEARDPESALRWACAAGALATTVPGASTSSPERSAIADLVAASY
jgi:ribokinase